MKKNKFRIRFIPQNIVNLLPVIAFGSFFWCVYFGWFNMMWVITYEVQE